MLLAKSRYAASGLLERATGERLLAPRPIGPATPVLEHEIQVGDRLDRLAQHYYNDDRLWWRILDANPTLAVPVVDPDGQRRVEIRPLHFAGVELDAELAGQVLLIPRAKES